MKHYPEHRTAYQQRLFIRKYRPCLFLFAFLLIALDFINMFLNFIKILTLLSQRLTEQFQFLSFALFHILHYQQSSINLPLWHRCNGGRGEGDVPYLQLLSPVYWTYHWRLVHQIWFHRQHLRISAHSRHASMNRIAVGARVAGISARTCVICYSSGRHHNSDWLT